MITKPVLKMAIQHLLSALSSQDACLQLSHHGVRKPKLANIEGTHREAHSEENQDVPHWESVLSPG